MDLFVFGCAGSSLLCMGFRSLWWLLPLRSTGLQAHRFQQSWPACSREWLSTCGTQVQSLCGMWDSPGPEIRHMSPALEGFLPTAPLRRSLWLLLKHSVSVGFLWHHADSGKETAISLPPGGSRSPGSPPDLHCHLRRDTLHLPLEELRVLAPQPTSTCTMGRVGSIAASQC